MTTLKKSIVASEGTRQHAKGSVAGDSPPKVQWWATVRRRFSGGRQSAEGSVAGDSPPKVQWWGNLAVKWFCSGAACCAFRKVRHSGNVLSRGEKSPVFGRVKNASHSPGRPADFIQSIGPPLRNPEQWHFVYDSKKWIPDYCLWDDDREKKPSFRKCSVWNPEKPLDTSFRWYDDTKKSAVHLELTT